MKPLSIKRKVLFLTLSVIGIVAASALALTYYLYPHLYIDKQIDSLSFQAVFLLIRIQTITSVRLKNAKNFFRGKQLC